ncbi:MAG: phosphoglycerate dehydrogenase [Roseiarcus sp.]|jgi:phosphoglycerate dehydrogenase-like enzyme
MTNRKIFVSWPGYSGDDPQTGGRLAAAGYGLILAPKLGARSESELIDLMQDACGAIVSTDPFTAKALRANPGLRIIARVGVGTDSIDHAAAAHHAVAISITPGMNAQPVADQTLAMILALVRRVVPQDQSVKSGRWDRVGEHTPSELPGKIVGLVGAGTIGRAVAQRLRGFDVSIVYFDDQVPKLDDARRVGSLDELLAIADIVTLHAPFVPETRHLIDAAGLSKMKPTALLVNTARGPLIDTAALFEALRRGAIAGAGLDVFEDEPPGADRLKDVPNLVCSAHVGGLSHESIRRMTVSATDSVLAVLAGEIPATVINPDVLRTNRARSAS